MLLPNSILCAIALVAIGDARISLGSASAYGVFAASTITNTGNTVINAFIGLSPGTSITGFPPGLNNGEDVNNNAATAAKADIQSAYNALAALTVTSDLTGQDLGGQTLNPGVYGFSSSGGLTGKLTLDAKGDSSAQFVFKFGSTLTTASASSVVLVNGAKGCNVFWQVGSSATLGTTTAFIGNVLAQASITATTGVSLAGGGLYALTAAVTLDTNTIDSAGTCVAPIVTSSIAPLPVTHTTTVTATKTKKASTTTTTEIARSTVTVTSTVATSKIKHTSTITELKTKSTTKTAAATLCPKSTSTKKNLVELEEVAKPTSTMTETMTETETVAGHTSKVTKGTASTKTVKATHTSTSTHLVTKSLTTTKTVTVMPKCTTTLARRNRFM